MAKKTNTVEVYLETGKKRTLASAVEWPGWTRAGSNEASSLEALLAYAPRYAQFVKRAKLEFDTPTSTDALHIVERLKGNATTDFGAPDVTAAADAEPLDDEALARCRAILVACFDALDATYKTNQDKELRKGPRGGGREINAIVQHAVESHYGYLSSTGWKAKPGENEDVHALIKEAKQTTAAALDAARAGELPEKGPRGGRIWPARYFVRRAAWHLLDHVWEIEDRAT